MANLPELARLVPGPSKAVDQPGASRRTSAVSDCLKRNPGPSSGIPLITMRFVIFQCF